MSKGMFSTSVGRKVLMSLSGLFLITFITLHLTINLFSIFSAALFNEASHFMGTNTFIQIMQFVLGAGFVLHIALGVWLTIKNRAARPIQYAHNKPSENSSLSSRSMIITGILVLAFLVLHMKDFFIEIKFGNRGGFDTDYDLLVGVFSIWYYTVIYVAAFILLGIHLNHGFQSAFQSIGINHKKYTPAIKFLGVAFSIIVALGFSAIALVHFVNA